MFCLGQGLRFSRNDQTVVVVKWFIIWLFYKKKKKTKTFQFKPKPHLHNP